MAGDPFLSRHGGEIRQALIMLQDDDGAFELLRTGSRAARSCAMKSR
jgi:hypothetical protein